MPSFSRFWHPANRKAGSIAKRRAIRHGHTTAVGKTHADAGFGIRIVVSPAEWKTTQVEVRKFESALGLRAEPCRFSMKYWSTGWRRDISKKKVELVCVVEARRWVVYG